ncbi:MAG TPA: hypothetical protein DDY91_06975 [Planctomycetaceae bacterium]|nr:hypothetical protein [Planctomycetaceae bacterium]
MTVLPSSSLAADDRPLDLSCRPDLVVRPVSSRSGVFWRIKDPVSLRYFELTPEEHFLLTRLKPESTLRQLSGDFANQFAPREVASGELRQFLLDLLENQLVIRSHHRRAVVAWGHPEASMTGHPEENTRRAIGWQSLLFHRFRGINPTPILDVIVRLLVACPSGLRRAMFWIPLALAAWLLAFHPVVGGWNLSGGFSALTFPAWGLMLLLLWFCRAFHELAHGVACRWFGAECPEIGIQWLLLSPVLYCDVSDAWLLSSRASRIYISAAGPLADLWLAAVGIMLATSLGVEPLRTVSWAVSLFCLANTLFLNGNPLLKYDGYHVLCDLMEEPNLSDKARARCRGWWLSLCLGLTASASTAGRVRHPTLVALYGVAAGIYRPWIWGTLLIGVAMGISRSGHPDLGWIVALSLIAVLLMSRVARLSRNLQDPLVRSQVDPHRAWWTVGAGLILSALFLLVPLPRTISATALVDAPHASPLYVVVPGRIEMTKPSGVAVLPGEVVARLSNPELMRQRDRLWAEVGQLEFRLRSYETQRLERPETSPPVSATRESLAAARRQLEEVQGDLERLNVSAPREGILWPPPWKLPHHHHHQQQVTNWTGSPLDTANRGCWLEVGTLVGQIGAPADLSIVLELPAHRADLVQEGQVVTVVLSHAPHQTLRGQISQVGLKMAESRSPDLGTGVGNSEGGPVLARISLSHGGEALQLRDRGSARISVAWTPCGRRVLEWLQSVFRPMPPVPASAGT